jgi:phosphoenolpyruvate carboxykinase (GTP)
MGDYFRHWINMQRNLSETPRIFHVNWFRKDGRQIPLARLQRKHARAEMDRGPRSRRPRRAKETPIGWVPRYQDIDWKGLDFSKDQVRRAADLRPRRLAHRGARP